MDLITVLAAAAAEHESHDVTPFYVVGGALAAFAVIAGGIGVARPNLGGAATKGMMAIGAILAAVTMVTMVSVS